MKQFLILYRFKKIIIFNYRKTFSLYPFSQIQCMELIFEVVNTYEK